MPEQNLEEFLKVEKVQQTSQNVLDVLTDSELQAKLFPLKITFIVFIFLFSVIIIYLFFKTNFREWGRLETIKEFSQANALLTGRRLARKWKKIKKGAESGSETQRKLGLMNAYNLLNDILASRGFSEDTLAAKLKNLSQEQISSLDELQRAVEVCADILKDLEYRLEKEQAKEVVQAFGRALVDLELL